MSQPVEQVSGYRFDDFFLDVMNRQLCREGRPLPLSSKYFDVLLLLVSQGGRLVEKRRIFDEVWEGTFVTDAALTQCIKDIRKQLGDDASNPRYIKTVPKHGYVFIGQAVAAEAQAAPEAASAEAPTRPYKFLDYFTEQDARLFVGRDAEIASIHSQIRARRTFILHGRSGVGKSSIVRAGLLPRLKAEGHQAFVIRSFTDPLHQMTAALADLLGEPAAAPLGRLVERFREAFPERLAFFFLDQFEEFFLLLDEAARRRFVEAMAQLLLDERLPLRLVFALREDLLAEMSLLKSAAPEIFHHEYRLNRLTREQAARAVAEPARLVGCRYEPALVERLIDDLADNGGVDPPQLQIVCDNLYDARGADGGLTLAAYERLGGASRILTGYLERVMRRFNAADLRVAREILTALIAADGQRLVARAGELGERLAARVRCHPTTVALLIEELVAARVVRRRSQDGEAWLELAHDFLTPEVSRWLSEQDRALKQARGVIERAMENYIAHELYMDADALELVLPFGERLGLRDAEADLLLASALNRALPAPAWLIGLAPDAIALTRAAAQSPDAEVRIGAVEASRFLPESEIRDMLRRLALWDRDLGVRKAASIAMADRFGLAAQDALSEGAGLVRRAISIAMIRDHDRARVELGRLSILVSALVIAGLVWVRVRRGGAEIVRQALGGALGGLASGVAGGVLLSIGLTVARRASLFDAASLMLVLTSFGAFIGALGGLGVSLSMAAASQITYRHSRWWSVIGGAAGGMAVGGSTNLLGIDTLRALFGQHLTGLTGAFEGFVMGAGVSLGAVLAERLIRDARPWQRIAGASLGAMCAGVLLTTIGGTLFSGSLEIVARSFADSQIRMDPIAPYFGEVRFGRTTQIVLGALEGLLFGAGMRAGVEGFVRRRDA